MVDYVDVNLSRRVSICFVMKRRLVASKIVMIDEAGCGWVSKKVTDFEAVYERGGETVVLESWNRTLRECKNLLRKKLMQNYPCRK